MDGNDALAVLPGGRLDTVSFVMNYVEFRIGYNVLRALTPPVVLGVGGELHRFPEPGSRDALCRLIDTEVEAAAEVGAWESDDRRIAVRTDDGQILTIPFSDDAGGPEWAHLVPAGARGELQVSEMFIWSMHLHPANSRAS